jgi:hypothetical protein
MQFGQHALVRSLHGWSIASPALLFTPADLDRNWPVRSRGVFQLITLPTEFNASNWAKAVLASTGIVSTQQVADGVRRVLDAAALTYVAAAGASLLQLIDLVLRQRD